MPSSVFMRPKARAAMSSVAQQQVFREVHTEDELRAVVAADKIGAYAFGSTGRRIVIASPISVKSPIVVTAPGILIESHGKIPISPAEDSLSCIFDTSAAINIEIRGLSFVNTLGVIEPSSCIKLGQISSVVSCSFSTGVDGVLIQSANYARITGNSFNGVSSNSVHIVAGAYNMISANMCIGNIVVDASASRTSIIGNTLTGFNINTSASSSGMNSIVGNIGVGTISYSSTDAVTSNT
jgi:hypothetical protein